MDQPNAEQYEWENSKPNMFSGIGLDVAYDVMSGIDDKKAIKLGFDGGEEELWDAVMREYLITENENALPPFF